MCCKWAIAHYLLWLPAQAISPLLRPWPRDWAMRSSLLQRPLIPRRSVSHRRRDLLVDHLVSTSLQEVSRKYPDAEGHIATVTDLGECPLINTSIMCLFVVFCPLTLLSPLLFTRLLSSQGGSVIHGVDATKLEASSSLRHKGTKFSKIAFNFPHAGRMLVIYLSAASAQGCNDPSLRDSGAGIKDQDHNILSNQRLLAGFFSSARTLLSSPLAGPVFTTRGPIMPPAGQVLVTLKSGGRESSRRRPCFVLQAR